MKRAAYFSPDISEFLHLLAKHDVRYLIVGGEAVIYYGYARLTGDIDLFYEITDGNVCRLFDVLVEFWNGEIPGIKSKSELMQKGMVFQFGAPPYRIDLINDIDGVEFADTWRAKTVDCIPFKNKQFAVYYIGIEDLIRNKKTVNRHKDKDDLRFLKKVKKRKK